MHINAEERLFHLLVQLLARLPAATAVTEASETTLARMNQDAFITAIERTQAALGTGEAITID